jgi:DNA-binding MarR family transcriptional regulator
MRAAEIQEWLGRNKNDHRVEGVTPVDLLDLPPVLNQVLRVLLSHGPMTQTQMRAALAALPDTLWLDDSDLSRALSGLVEQQWLLRSATDSTESEPAYQINLRAKARVAAATGGLEALDF